jgi:hypothetical protein
MLDGGLMLGLDEGSEALDYEYGYEDEGSNVVMSANN